MKHLRVILSVFVIWVMIAAVVLAATWEYRFPISIKDTSGAARTYLPVGLGFAGQTLVDNGKISATGNNTNMQVGTTSIKYMLTTTNATAVLPTLGASATQTANLYTGYSPEQTSFAIIPLDGGYVTTLDNATLELSDNFSVSMAGYVDTDFETDKNLINKAPAFNVSVFSDGTIAATINSTTTANSTVMAGAAKEYYTLNDDTSGSLYGATWVAQSTANLTTSFTTTGFSLKLLRVLTPDTVTVHLRTSGGSNNLPTGADLTTGTLDGNALTTSSAGQWYEGTWATPQNLTAGSSYAIIVSAASGNVTDYVSWRIDNSGLNKYGGGNGSGSANSGVTWAAYATSDLMFALNASASAIASGEKTVTVSMDSPFLGINSNGAVTLPVTANLTLNAPLWQADCSVSPFTTIDSTAFTSTVIGATWSSDGYIFDGLNDTIAVTYGASLNITGDITIETWLKHDGTAGIQEIIRKSSQYVLEKNGNGFSFNSYNGTDWQFSNTITILPNVWTHLVATRSGDTVTLYRDTVAITPKTFYGNPASNTSNLYFGSNANTERWYDGLLAESRIYNRALTPTEITQNYNATKWKYDGTTSSALVSTLASVPDNANPIIWMKDTMAYADNISVTVNGVRQLYYAPTSMLTATTLPDRETATANDGTITWGTNSNVTVTFGAPESYASTAASAASIAGFQMPNAVLPAHWFNVPELITLSQLPFFPMIYNVQSQLGYPNDAVAVQAIYFIIAVALAFTAFLVLTIYTRSVFIGSAAMIMVLVVSSMQSVVPGWIPFVCGIMLAGIMYLYKQVAY